MRILASTLVFVSAFLLAFNTWGQGEKKMEVSMSKNAMCISHTINAGEDIYSIAQLYNVPANVLNRFNNLSFYDSPQPGQSLLIPLGNYNFQTRAPYDSSLYRTVWYTRRADESIDAVALQLGLPLSVLQMNNGGDMAAAKTIKVGWLMYTEAKNEALSPVKESVAPNAQLSPSDTTSLPVVKPSIDEDTLNVAPNEFIKIYKYQTSEEVYRDSLSGMVTFYKPQTALKNNMFYAFSDDIPRGKVVKVVNPSNGKYIFAKVIGALPKTKQYINAKLGLSGHARDFLDTREIKLWCDFFFK